MSFEKKNAIIMANKITSWNNTFLFTYVHWKCDFLNKIKKLYDYIILNYIFKKLILYFDQLYL